MRVLFLAHRVPYAPNRGDRIRAYHTLRYLKTREIPVCLVALAHDDEELALGTGLSSLADAVHVARVPRLRNLARAGLRLATDEPLTHVLLDSPDLPGVLAAVRRDWQPDLVFAYCSGMARFAMAPPLDDLPFVLDMVDVDSFKWESLGRGAWSPRRWVYRREARTLGRFESKACGAARATLVVSARERDALRRLDPALDAVVLPNGVDVEAFRNPDPPSRGREVVFTGVFNYQPNEEGALWLIDDVWPLVRERMPDARLTLVGAGPGAGLRRRAEGAGVTVTGGVPDVRPYLWRAAVAAAPLRTAQGLQNKVLEAVAAGLPAVVTDAVAGGLPGAVRPACSVASDAAAFADAIGRLLAASPESRRQRAAQADLSTLAWETCLEPLAGILQHAQGNRS